MENKNIMITMINVTGLILNPRKWLSLENHLIFAIVIVFSVYTLCDLLNLITHIIYTL